MATRAEVTRMAIAAARAAAREYRNAREMNQHRAAVRAFSERFSMLSRYLQQTGQSMPSDLVRDYNEIVARNGMLLGGAPSGGSAESELEIALQELDRYVAGGL